jgi:hypothetical protein
MNLFQIGWLFSLPVHTYLFTSEIGYWSIFIYLYMTGCEKCRGRSGTFPVWRKRCISRTMMKWLTLKWSVTLLWLKPPFCMPVYCHLSGMVNFRRTIPIKCPQLTLSHRHARFDWSYDHLGWTIRTWRRVHWSDESRFLLHPTDGRARVWCQRNTSFQDTHILGTTSFGGHQLYWTAVAAPIWIWAGALWASFCEVCLHVDGQEHSPFDENAASVVQWWNAFQHLCLRTKADFFCVEF